MILFAEYLSTVHSNKAENRRGTSKWKKEKAGTMIFLLFLKITSVMYREKTTAEVRESSATKRQQCNETQTNNPAPQKMISQT